MDGIVSVGVIGTGFVSRNFVLALGHRSQYKLGRVLTRRPVGQCPEYPRQDALTDSVDDLIDHSDVILECTGDVAYAADTIERILAAGKPVVTLNAEFHATLGSHFVGKGMLTEAEGDQPGCIAALHEEAVSMGFKPLVYGNMKGFLNRNPTREDMQYWGDRQGCSVQMVTSFTDGTKVQVEQCLVANGLGAGIAQEDLLGIATEDLGFAAREFGAVAEKLGYPISDYVLGRTLPHGIFIVARHDEEQAPALKYFKQGDGPFYLLPKNYIMVHLEIFKTIDRVMRGQPVLLDNGVTPRISVAAVAKRDLAVGEKIKQGAGGFELRGICVNIADRPDHLPICLANDLELRRPLKEGEILTFADVALAEDNRAVEIWRGIEQRSLQSAERRTLRAVP